MVINMMKMFSFNLLFTLAENKPPSFSLAILIFR